MLGVRPALRLTVGCAVAAVWLLGFPALARSQGNLRAGPFRILPSLDLAGEYNDNILLAPRDELHDFIWTIGPGIAIELPGRRSAFRLGYRADVLRYTDHTELDTVEHTVQADARYDFPWGLNLHATDEFKHTQDFPGFPVPELTQIVDRNENTLRAGGEYTLGRRFSIGLDYNFYWVEYDAGPTFDVLDREDHTIGITGYYRIFPKTSVLAEYDYQLIRYALASVARDRDSDANFFKVGVKGDLTAKTSATVKVGAEFKDYDNPARPDFDGFVAEGEIVYKYRDPSQLRIYGGRANVESTFQDNNYFTASYGGIEVQHYVTSVLILRLSGLVGVNDYPTATTVGTETKERSDDFYQLGAGVRYFVRRWMSVDLDYQYLARNSNFSDFDYTNNRVTATLRLTY
jgi:hypothetical protein